VSLTDVMKIIYKILNGIYFISLIKEADLMCLVAKFSCRFHLLLMFTMRNLTFMHDFFLLLLANQVASITINMRMSC